MKTYKNTNCIKKKILTAVLFACLVYVYFMIFILSADNAEESSDISIKVMDFFVDIYYKLKGESGENTVIVQNAVPLEKIIRKAAHFTEYMAVGFLSFSIVILWVKRLGIGMGIIALQLLLSGMLDEIHQYFVPGRYASFKDVLIDFTGGMAGIGVVLFLRWCKRIFVVSKKHKKET